MSSGIVRYEYWASVNETKQSDIDAAIKLPIADITKAFKAGVDLVNSEKNTLLSYEVIFAPTGSAPLDCEYEEHRAGRFYYSLVYKDSRIIDHEICYFGIDIEKRLLCFTIAWKDSSATMMKPQFFMISY